MLITLAAILITFFSRLAYYRCFPFKNLDTDAVNHLMLVRAIRENKGRIPERIPRYLLDTNDYPNGFHRFIALLPIPVTVLERHGGLVPIIMDTLFVALTGLTIHLAGGHAYAWLLLFPLIRLLWGYEVRAFLFGERAFGIFFGNIYLASTLLFVQTHQPLYLLGAVFGFFGFSTTSQFTWQAVTFFTCLLSLMLFNHEFWLVFALSFILSALISKGYSVRVLLGLIRHSYFYKTHIMKTNWGIRDFYGEWKTVFHRLKIRNLIQILYENSLAKWVTNYPVSVPFLLVFAHSGFVLNPWAACSLCGLLLLPVIATETFKFWGEPERYLEYSLLPAIVYLSFYPVTDNLTGFILALMLGLLSVWFQLNLKCKLSGAEVALENDFDALENLLAELPDSVILPVPLRCAYRPGYTLDKHRYVGNFINIGKGDFYQALVDLLPEYMGFPGRNLQQYTEQYQVDYIIFHKKYYAILDKRRLHGQPYYDFSPYELTHDSGYFQCYKIRRS